MLGCSNIGAAYLATLKIGYDSLAIKKESGGSWGYELEQVMGRTG